MKKALFIVNPNAGKMAMRENLMDVLSKFNARDYATTVYITQKANDATEYIQNHGEGYDLIISCGGDGTFNEILHGVTASDKEDGDLTSKIKVVENTVDTKKVGNYKVTYKVTDSDNNETTLTINVTVKAKEMPKTGGRNSLVIVAIALGLVALGAFVIKSKNREA